MKKDSYGKVSAKDVHVIVVGASWYGDWARDALSGFQDLGVSSDIVYTNSVGGAADGNAKGFKAKAFSSAKNILRKASPALFERAKRSRAEAAGKDLIGRVDQYAATSKKQIIALFIWMPLGTEVLEELKKRGVRLVLWQGEAAIRDPRWTPSFKYFEHLFQVEESWIRYFPSDVMDRTSVLPLATNPHVHYPLEHRPVPGYESDVSLVALYKPERAAIVEGLHKFDFKVYGHGWQDGFKQFPWLKTAYRGTLTGEETNKVFNSSKICVGALGISFHPDGRPTTTQRVFDVAICKGFQISQYNPLTTDLFGDAIIMFESSAQLLERTEYYLAHPEERTALAEKAYELAKSDHTYVNRVKKLFEVIGVAL
jgi:spore maturation protein CgeB